MFSESAALSVGEIAAWADEEAEAAADQLRLAGRCAGLAVSEGVHRGLAAKHQARARWLYETLAAATVDREK